MHEMSLCEGVLNILEEQSQAQNFQRVKTVWMEIGELSCVEISALNFGFEVVTKGTLADGAKLEIIQVPGQAWCMQCMKTVSIHQRYDACNECGSYQLQVTGGEELNIKELEVE